MPGKPLRALARQFRQNHGLVLVSTFDGGIRCGTILNRRATTNIDNIGHLSPRVTGLPTVEGPVPCLLAELRRSHDLSLGALAELDLPKTAVTKITAAAKSASAVEMAGSFDAPVVYTMDLLEIERAFEATHGIWDDPLGQALRTPKGRVVFQVIKSRLSFTFRTSGSGGIDVKAKVPKLAELGIQGKWQWRNSATLESKDELVVAVQTARYARVRKRFVPTAR